jgi:prepilin-type N-terminal cleavage/methylation domain-containing protein
LIERRKIMNTQNPKQQLGYTLIELSIGLAITSLVLVGVVAGVQKMMDQVNVNRSVSQIATAAEKIRLLIKRDGDTSFVTLPNVTLPINNAFATSNVINPGAGNVQVFTASGNQVNVGGNGSSTSQHFRIWLGQVTPGTCAELAGALEGIANSMWIANNGWQTVKDDRSSLVFNAATARQNCVNNAMNQIWLEFLK